MRPVVLLLVFLWCGAGWADELDRALRKLPQDAADLLPPDAILKAQPFGKDSRLIETRLVEVEGMPFRRALEVRVTGTAKYFSDVGFALPVAAALREGDAVLLSLSMRCLETQNDIGKAILGAAMQSSASDQVFRTEFTAGKDWERVYVRGKVTSNASGNRASVRFIAGFRPQRMQIAQVELRNYERRVTVDALPSLPVGYEGSEADAPWRGQAAERIEKYRKSDLVIEVTDAAGRPVTDAEVSARLTNLAFGLGGAYSARLHSDPAFRDELPVFQKHFKDLFNRAVLPNELKWKQYTPEKKRWAEIAHEWLSANGIPVRGHCIIWPGWRFLPEGLKQYADDPAKLRQLTIERIDQVAGDWKGKLVDWDVVNECWRQDDLMKILGWDILIDWFRRTREVDPSVKLYYNDANTIANNQPGHQDHYYETVQWLLKKGAPVDGVGFQCHHHTLVPPRTIYERLERFARLGPEMQITEFDIQVPGITEEVLAQYTRDFLTVIFSHPKTVGVVTWMAGNPLRSAQDDPIAARAAYFNRDWTIKPNGKAWLDLRKQWTTNASGRTDRQGRFRARGFHGEYEIAVRKAGATRTTRATLSSATGPLRVRM